MIGLNLGNQFQQQKSQEDSLGYKSIFDEVALPGELDLLTRAWLDAHASRKSRYDLCTLGHFLVAWQKIRAEVHKNPPKFTGVRTVLTQIAAGELSTDAGLVQISVIISQIRDEGISRALGIVASEGEDRALESIFE